MSMPPRVDGARWIFSAYVVTFGTSGSLYGSFGSGVATLFVLGAALAAVIGEPAN
jgi:hypothetical protein